MYGLSRMRSRELLSDVRSFLLLRFSRSLSRFETQDIKTQRQLAGARQDVDHYERVSKNERCAEFF